MPADGGIRFGPYVLIRRLARGGMAEVFLAQQRGLEGFDRRVAVKRILPHLADNRDFVKMFLAEAKLAAQLSHPNIVHIYDFGKVDHDYFIAMEFVDGIHAGEVFKAAERERALKMSPTLIARIGADAAAALHYAHELMGQTGRPLELVHRDVSPANIMISYDGVVKLCDFGIAKAMAASDQLTNPGQVKGKYAYMSPEQTIAAPLDGRSDVFSLGICLWELLAGKTIVPRGDAVDSMRMIRDGKLQGISQVAPATPPPLAKAITWALQTKREQRATAAELATALEAFIKASPELATSMQLAQWVRTRFPRDASGPHPRLTEVVAAGQGTSVSPGTSVAPGTVGGIPSNRLDPVTPSSNLIAASRISDPGDPGEPDETAETVALLSSSDLQGITSEERDNAAVLDELARDLNNRPTVPRGIDVRAADLAARPTVITPPLRPSVGSMRAADESTVRDRTETIVVTDADQEETAFASGAFRPQVPSGPTVVPTRLQHAIERRPATPVPTDPHGRAQARRFLVPFLVLTGIAVVTFLIALAARGTPEPPPVPRDASIVVTPLDVAVTPDAPPPDTAPPPPDAPQPTALLVLRTTPAGATLRVGDQTRKAPAELALPDGDYTVVAEADGFHPETREVSLLRDERVVLEIVFTRRIAAPRPAQPGTLVVATTPYSDVFNGTRKLGQTPFEIEIAAGTYTLTFKHPARPPVTRKVTIQAGKPTRLKFDLPR